MIENQEMAREILQTMLGIHDRMEELILRMDPRLPPEELLSLKRGIGHVIYESFQNVIDPICKKHPSLRPSEMDN